MLTKMETSTVNALITSCATLMAAWMGLQVKKYADKSIVPKKSIQEKTLSDVLVPVLNASSVLNRYTWNEREKMLIELLHDKQIFIPPTLATQMQFVLSSDDSERKIALQRLNTMAESYASWYRKHLGYPYDAQKIDKRYTANSQRNEVVKGFASLILYVTWILCSLYTVFVFIYLSGHNYTVALTFWNIVPVLIFLFGIPFVVINVEK